MAVGEEQVVCIQEAIHYGYSIVAPSSNDLLGQTRSGASKSPIQSLPSKSSSPSLPPNVTHLIEAKLKEGMDNVVLMKRPRALTTDNKIVLDCTCGWNSRQ